MDYQYWYAKLDYYLISMSHNCICFKFLSVCQKQTWSKSVGYKVYIFLNISDIIFLGPCLLQFANQDMATMHMTVTVTSFMCIIMSLI